jgi:1-phosphofructokinase family hexose kinase
MITTITLNPALDKTVYVDKLVPNDTNRVKLVEMDAGGKGINCSRMLNRLGAETSIVAFIGGKTGDLIETVLAKEAIPTDFIRTRRPTRSCIAVQDSSGEPPTTFNERGGPIEHDELVEVFEKAKNAARQSSYLILGGSVPVGVNPDVYNVLIQIAINGGARAVLDADGEALAQGIKARPFMIKPNCEEAERYFGKQFESKGDVARAALKFAEMGIDLVIISLGKQGLVAHYEGLVYSVAPPEVKAISTIGSGDSLIAGVVHGLDQGMGIEDALKVGCAAGAATALSDGADIGLKEDVDRLCSECSVTRLEPAPVA